MTHLSTIVTPFLDIQVAGIACVYYTFLPGVSSVSFSENSGGLSSLLFPSSHELTTTQCREANYEVLLMVQKSGVYQLIWSISHYLRRGLYIQTVVGLGISEPSKAPIDIYKFRDPFPDASEFLRDPFMLKVGAIAKKSKKCQLLGVSQFVVFFSNAICDHSRINF